MNESRRTEHQSLWIAAAMLGCAVTIVGGVMLLRQLPGVAVPSFAAVLGVVASAGVARWWLGGRTAERSQVRRVLLVGTGAMSRHLAEQANASGCEVIGYVEDRKAAGEVPVLGRRADLAQIVEQYDIDQVLIADPPSRRGALMELLEREEIGAEIYVVPEMYELALCSPGSLRLGDVALFRMPQPRLGWSYQFAKRALDFTVSLVLLIVLAPFLLASMLAIRLSSPGPALFRQERVGKDGRLFEIIKLRTMVIDAERDGPRLCEGKADPRLTPVGRFLRKTHLDEVPQLINVLRGEMSLVGPRPERPCFVEQFQGELPRYSHRHRIHPGITGLAQVNGFYHSSAREKLRYDLMYLYHHSLWMDVCILYRTFMGIFR